MNKRLGTIALIVFMVLLLAWFAPSFGQAGETYWWCREGYCVMREETLKAWISVIMSRQCL